MPKRSLSEFAQASMVVSPVNLDQSINSVLKKVSTDIGLKADEQIKKYNNAEGTAAGLTGAPQFKDPGTLAADTFNAAAKHSLMVKQEVTNQAKMVELSEQYKNDPAGYQEATNAYIKGTITELSLSPYTRNEATLMGAKLKLEQESQGYIISRTWQKQQAAQMRADTDTLQHQLKVNTYKVAGGLFSKDPTMQQYAIENYVLNKKQLETALYGVSPDGSKIYTPEAIQKRLSDFHSSFYINAVQNYVSNNELSTTEVQQIADGSLKVPIEGLGEIDIASEVGVENYQQKIKNWTFAKIKEKNRLQKSQSSAERAIIKEEQEVIGVKLLEDIYSGNPISSTDIVNLHSNNLISYDGAKAALRLSNSPNTGINDTTFEAEMRVKQIQGVDVRDDIVANADKLNKRTFIELMTNNAKIQNDITEELDGENEKWIVKETVQKTGFGIEDPKTIRFASDIVQQYRQYRNSNMSSVLAMEKARESIDLIKDMRNKRLYNSVPKYLVITDSNLIDKQATYEATKKAYKSGLLSEDEFNIEVKRLKVLQDKPKKQNKSVTTGTEKNNE